MMKKIAALFALYASVFLIFACANYGFFWGRFDEDTVDERSPSLDNLNSKAPDLKSQTQAVSTSYSFIIYTDLHYGSDKKVIKEKAFLEWLEKRYVTYSADGADKSKLPRFILNLGDTADGGHTSEYNEYIAFENKIKACAGKHLYNEDENTPDSKRQFKVFSILGNHDIYNNGADGFYELLYPYSSSYYFSVDTNPDDSFSGFSFYFLDSANGTLGPKQLEDFESKVYADPRHKLVFTHYPIYAGGTNKFTILQNTMERNLLLTYFAENKVKQAFEGHAHLTYGFNFKIFHEDVLGSLRFNDVFAVCTVNEETGAVSTEIVEL